LFGSLFFFERRIGTLEDIGIDLRESETGAGNEEDHFFRYQLAIAEASLTSQQNRKSTKRVKFFVAARKGNER
jgi:hypothetical protein